tara:strand:+ start:5506 stop:5976 length:471 start_codon:yes stop_codon:yes gene_type:complete
MSKNTNAKLLPRNPNAALQEVMSAIQGLQKIYELENKALNEADTNSFLKLQDDKLKAATLYQSYMGQMIARKKDIPNADPAMRNKLKEMHKDFSELSEKNLVAIERMQRCTEMLGNTLRNAAIRSAKSQKGYNYGQNGAFSDSKKRGISSGVSETA